MDDSEVFGPSSPTTTKRKGGSLKKSMKKAQSDLSTQKANVNVVSMNDLFGKTSFGGVSAPVIDMGSSYGSTGSFLSGEEFHFKSDNPIYVPYDEFGEPIQEEEKHYRTNGTSSSSASRPKRWTLTSLSFFSRKTET